MRLYLIRHPLPDVAPGTCYGRTDLGLAEDAAAVAARLRAHLPAAAPLYSSPLQRCRLLAQALHAAPRFDARLMEMDFGAWEMQAWQDIDRAALDAWAADPGGFAPPGGESPRQMWQRAAQFHEALLATGAAEAVLVTHSGVIKALCGLRLGLADAEWMQLTFDYGGVSLIEGTRCVWQDAGLDAR